MGNPAGVQFHPDLFHPPTTVAQDVLWWGWYHVPCTLPPVHSLSRLRRMGLQTRHLGKDTLVLLVIISLPTVEVMNGAPVISWRAIVYIYSKVMSYLIYTIVFALLDFELLNLRNLVRNCRFTQFG